MARVLDVTIGTVRIIFVSRGNKFIAPFLGFFEVLVWLLTMGQIMRNLSNPFCYIAYALGFAFGTFVGIKIEERTALGNVVLRVITRRPAGELIEKLRGKGYGVTDIPAEGSRGKVSVIYTISERRNLEKAIKIVNKYNPKAFYTIEDIRSVNGGIFPAKKLLFKQLFPKSLKHFRKIRIYHRMNSHRKAK